MWHVLEVLPVATPFDFLVFFLDDGGKALEVYSVPKSDTLLVLKSYVESQRRINVVLAVCLDISDDLAWRRPASCIELGLLLV